MCITVNDINPKLTLFTGYYNVIDQIILNRRVPNYFLILDMHVKLKFYKLKNCIGILKNRHYYNHLFIFTSCRYCCEIHCYTIFQPRDRHYAYC